MKFASKIATILGAAAICAAPGLTQAAEAAGLGGWNYQYDLVGDGSGGSQYDIRGMAMFRDANRVYVALTGGTPITGVAENNVTNGTIGWGDMFFNFSGKSFSEAEASGSLMGVRFAQTNDSQVSLGVYSGVRTQSVTLQNDGYGSLDQYYDYGWGKNGHCDYDIDGKTCKKEGNIDKKNNSQGSALSSQAQVTNYFGGGSIQTSIASGNLLGGINVLSSTQLSTLGLNFGNKAGSQTFGFSFDANLLPRSEFMANVFLECGNDGMAFAASGAPEPTTMAGVAMGMAGIAGFKRRRKQQQAAKTT
jgi:hypothetical protein